MATAKTGGEPTVEELKSELKTLRDDFAKLVETVKELGTEQANAAMRKARKATEGAAESLRMSAEEAKERGEAFAEEIEEMIQRRPLMSILAALGIGYVVGRIRH